jgi:cyclopropane-fatty-acyl-phospholipid synthase
MGLIANDVSQGLPIQPGVELLADLMGGYRACDFQVQLWDGTTVGSDRPRFRLVLKQPGVRREMLLDPSELALGESYIFDDLDVEGDIQAAVDFANHLLMKSSGLPPGPDLARALRKFPVQPVTRAERRTATLVGAAHSKDRDRQAISFHYDLPPEFFALWLDRSMVYSCAYFADEEAEPDLDAAQCRKLDNVCRKLRLRRGDRLLDIGCGWGGLLIHAARHYGAEALGITLSVRQAEVARQRIRDSGLSRRCRVEVCDYRDLEPDRQFDRIVSIGMFEHVGKAQLSEYFSRTRALLRPGGAFLNSGISACATDQPHGASFIDRYVFPDGELVPLNTSLGAAEECGFEVRDVESLREHYALTLDLWVRRLEAHAERARRITNGTIYRTWRLYMAASAHRFRSARLNLYQMLLARPVNGQSGMPLTRTDWYCD